MIRNSSQKRRGWTLSCNQQDFQKICERCQAKHPPVMFPTIDVVWQPGSRGQIRYQRKEETIRNQKRAHQEVEKIFRVLFPEQGLAVREEQIRLCHEMLDTLLGEQIALCDAGVGIGKTYAYLVACVLLRKYSMLTGRGNPLEQRPVVVSTSSIEIGRAHV